MTTSDASLNGLQQIVDRLAASLQRSVAIDDPQGRLVVSSGHFGEEDDLRVWAIVHRYSDPRVMAHFKSHGIYGWTKPGRTPENPELQFKARVCCPIRDHNILFGHLFLIDEDVTDAEIDQAAAACEQIGHLMYRRLTLHEETQQRSEILARQLISPDERTRRRAVQEAVEEQLLAVTEPAVVLIVRVVEPAAAASPDVVQADVHTAVELTTRDRYRAVHLAWIRTGDVVLLLFGRATERAREVGEQVIARLLASGHRSVAGIGAIENGDGCTARSFADASVTTGC